MAGDLDLEDGDLLSMAQDGEMDYSKWPALLERLIPRLEHIVYSEFPPPSIPLPGSLPVGSKREASPVTIRASTERDEPPEKRLKVDKDANETLQQSSTQEDNSLALQEDHSPNAKSAIDPPRGTLPPLLLTLLHTIVATLRTSFLTSPPHTSQRLAELLLTPRKHYQTLPSYLRALDRIVSVASPASIFPLKNLSANSLGTNGAILNGVSSPSQDPADDVDFIGGAELTEIPWAPKPQLLDTGAEGSHTTTNGAPTNASDLRTESTSLIEGPNGLGGVETVTVTNGDSGSTAAQRENVQAAASNTTDSTTAAETSTAQHGITQGEILRQEQEAGIVPVPSPAHSSQGGTNSRVTRSSAAASAAASRAVGVPESEIADDTLVAETPTPDEEIVHVRGPGVIGMEDMGPQAPGSGLQGGIDVEGALGRRGEIVLPAEEGDEGPQGTGATQELDGMNLKEEKTGAEEKGEDGDAGALVEKKEGAGENVDQMNVDADGVPDDEVPGGAAEEGAG